MPVRSCAFLVAVVVLLASSFVCHVLAKDSAQLDAAAARVDLVPKAFGDWEGQTDAVDEKAFDLAGARGYWSRTYVNQRTRESVQVILMCGRPGKMSVHTPEVCYGGAGFEVRDQPTAYTLSSPPDAGQLWTAQFIKKGVVPTRLRLYWGWNSHDVWQAAPVPRWQFRGEPFLYKLYVSRDVSAQPGTAPQADITAEFLRQFVPEMKKALYPSETRDS